jgi:hypothetical protein
MLNRAAMDVLTPDRRIFTPEIRECRWHFFVNSRPPQHGADQKVYQSGGDDAGLSLIRGSQ